MQISLKQCLYDYIDNMKMLNLSENTIHSRQKYGLQFIQWCEDRDINDASQLTRKVAESYQRYVHRMRKVNGQPYAIKTQMIILDAMRGLCRHMAKSDIIERNPSDRMEMPKVPESLPKAILNHEEMNLILMLPDTTTIIGIRDRAILEVLWATGIRRSELINLNIYSIDFSQETVMVTGKGKRDRVVPIGQQALKWVRVYLDEARPVLIQDHEEMTLFIGTNGKLLKKVNLSTMVNRYIAKADIEKSGSCHLIRHSVGTLLMRNGLSIRLVQQLLGHKKIETTQIYTHLTIMDLKKAYKDAHPSAK